MWCRAASSSTRLGPKISSLFPQSGQVKKLMFSTRPRTFFSSISAMRTLFSTIMPTSSCGEATTTTPSTVRLWKTVSGTSPVPGGMSTNMMSTSSQKTSVQNCFTAPAITGPRHTTGSLGFSTRMFRDMMRTPPFETHGTMPFGPLTVPPEMPNARGIDGPVMSASSTAAFSPRFAAAAASMHVTRLLPTPPLPLATATTLPTRDHGLSFARKSGLPPSRSEQLLPQFSQSCVQSSAISIRPFFHFSWPISR